MCHPLETRCAGLLEITGDYWGLLEITGGDLKITEDYNSQCIQPDRPAPPPVFSSCTTRNQSPSFILRSTARSLVKKEKMDDCLSATVHTQWKLSIVVTHGTSIIDPTIDN